MEKFGQTNKKNNVVIKCFSGIFLHPSTYPIPLFSMPGQS